MIWPCTAGTAARPRSAPGPGVPTRLELVTDDTGGCPRAFVLASQGIQKILPESGTTAGDLGRPAAGTLRDTCGKACTPDRLAGRVDHRRRLVVSVVLGIAGMHRAGCGLVIDEAAEDLPGVARSHTDPHTEPTVIELDGTGAGVLELLAASEAEGYQTRPVDSTGTVA